MIKSTAELNMALRNLAILEQSLEALRDQLSTSNPDLLAVAGKAYISRISALQADIAGYLYQNPSEVSLLAAGFATARGEALAMAGKS